MLVLTRKKDESIMIGDDIEIIVTQIAEDRVKIGIIAPKAMKIFRKELIQAVEDENIKSTMAQKDKLDTVRELLGKNK